MNKMTPLEQAIKERNYWHDLYFREVHGLNNEGHPIGGEPASGLIHEVQRLKNELKDERERWTSLLTEKWHSGEGQDQTLAEYMGLTDTEYSNFLKNS